VTPHRADGTGGVDATPHRTVVLVGLAVAVALVIGAVAVKASSHRGHSAVAVGSSTSAIRRPLAAPTTLPPPTVTTTPPSTTTVARAVAAAVSGTPLPSSSSRAVAVADGNDVVVAGGLDAGKQSTPTVLRFTPATGGISSIGTLGTAVHDTAAAVVRGHLMVFGGGTDFGETSVVQSFNLTTLRSRRVGNLPERRSDHVAVAWGFQVLIVGGFDGSNPTNDVLATVDGVSFRTVGRLAAPARYPAAAVVGTTLYVFGGEWNGAFSSTIQAIDLPSGTTRFAGQLPAGLAHAAAVQVGGQVYLVGGRTAAGYQDAILAFDPVTAQLRPAGHLPAAESDAASTSFGSGAYLFGGEQPAAMSSIVGLAPAA
jgi:N-acetylneuraminic acid mutarotase